MDEKQDIIEELPEPPKLVRQNACEHCQRKEEEIKDLNKRINELKQTLGNFRGIIDVLAIKVGDKNTEKYSLELHNGTTTKTTP